MFKATLDGNGLVIYSTSNGGEILADMPVIGSVSEAPSLNLDPSIILKGAFAAKYWFDGGNFDETYALEDYKPFYGIVTAPLGGAGSGGGLMQYLLSRHPNLKLISVEVEYKELIGSSIPVALAMWTYVAGDWSSSFTPFYVKEVANRPEWQVAKLDLLAGHVEGFPGACPFRNFTQSGIVLAGSPFGGRSEIAGCFTHVAMWAGSPLCEERLQIGIPVFHICGGVGAVRRISFNFAGSQFWTGFTNSAELIHLYDRPAPPDPVDPDAPVEPEAFFTFEGNAFNWVCDDPIEGGTRGYPTPNSESPACALNISGGTVPWTLPCAIVKAGGGTGGVAVLYEDGYNIKWHGGTNGGVFRFFADGTWCFDPVEMFYDVPIGETRVTSCDFIVQDEFREYLCRATATIHGQEPFTPYDQYTLRGVYLFGNSTQYSESNPDAVIFSGNVFSNAEDPAGWTVTKVRGSIGNVGIFVGTVNSSINAAVKISANGDYQVRIGPNFLYNATPPDYNYGHVFICECSYEAVKSGTTRSNVIYLYVTLKQPPGFLTNASSIVKIAKDGNASGQIDLTPSNLIGVTSYTCFGVYGWCPEEGSCDPADFVDGPASPLNYQHPITYEPTTGCLFSLTTEGEWTFDTDGAFDFFGPTDVTGFYLTVYYENQEGASFVYELMVQVGDVTQDYFEGP